MYINDKAGNRLTISKDENTLIGMNVIMRYLHVRSPVTFYQMVELYGLPAVKRPDGQWLSTMSSIDTWIFLAAELDFENRPHSRGTNEGHALAEARLKSRLELAHEKAQQRTAEARANGGKGATGARPRWSRKGYQDQVAKWREARRQQQDKQDG